MTEESQEMESSPVSEEVVTDESTTEVAGDTASSSDATEVEAETAETLADVVQDALQPVEETVEEVEATEETESMEPYDDSEKNAEAAESDDDKLLPFHKHPRFKGIVAEKNELKETVSRLQNDSDQYSKITDFIAKNNLSAKDAVEGFKIMSAIRNNPESAYGILGHHLNNVSKVTGRSLPEDIQTKLDDGFLDEDAAKELSQSRASLTREQNLRKRAQEKVRRQQVDQQSGMLTDALQTWGESTLAKDLDFGLKQEEFNDRVVALVNERGQPRTQTEVLALVEDAYATVNERFKSRQPQPQTLRTATGGKLSGTPRTEPKTLSDAISMAYESA
jgi:hypothetical protein